MTTGAALPQGWVWASVEQLGDVQLGRQRSPDKLIGDSPTKYIRAANITEAGIDFADVLAMDFSEQEKATFALQHGDVLLTEASGSAEHVGRPAIWSRVEGLYCFQNTILRFSPHGIGSDFAYFMFLAMQKLGVFRKLSGGVGINHLSAGKFSKLAVAVPPAIEQTRIVAKLEELLSDLDAGVAELKSAQKKLQQYRQSLLKAAVDGALTAEWRVWKQSPSPQPLPRQGGGAHAPLSPRGRGAGGEGGLETETGAQLLARILKQRRARWEEKQLAKFKEQGKAPPKDWQAKYPEPVAADTSGLPELPQGWVWATIDQLSVFVRNGISSTPNKEKVGYPILRINSVRPMSVDTEEIRHIDLSAVEARDYFVEKGDLLATRYNGSVDLLGVFGLVRSFSEPVLHPDKLIRIKPVVSHTLGNWIEIAANTGPSRSYIVGRVKTTAGQTGISGDDLKKMPIPLPSLSEQGAAVSQIELMLATIQQQMKSVVHALKQSTAQRQNILRAAFAGQLVPQDPDDEPASVLLERIRAERQAAAMKPRIRKSRADA